MTEDKLPKIAAAALAREMTTEERVKELRWLREAAEEHLPLVVCEPPKGNRPDGTYDVKIQCGMVIPEQDVASDRNLVEYLAYAANHALSIIDALEADLREYRNLVESLQVGAATDKEYFLSQAERIAALEAGDLIRVRDIARMTRERDEARDRILALEAERDGLKVRLEKFAGIATAKDTEIMELNATIEALNAKIKSLSAHQTCGCSYDKPDDVCMHHSPMVATLQRELESEREKIDDMSECMTQDGIKRGLERDALTARVKALEEELVAANAQAVNIVAEVMRIDADRAIKLCDEALRGAESDPAE